jgi:PilX N-terminal
MMGERGAALIVALLAMLLLSAVGAALVLATSADVLISANAGASSEAFYAADAAFERTLAELRGQPGFTPVLNGSVTSAFIDGPPSGQRTLADGSRLGLTEVVNLANCQKPAGCTDADMDAGLRDRPWGARNPRWRLFSWGPLIPTASTVTGLPIYVVSMVADDPSETDGDPWQDGVRKGTPVNPGAGILLVRAEAFGRRGAHRSVEGSVARRDLVAQALWEGTDPATRGPAPVGFPLLQVLAWREVR